MTNEGLQGETEQEERGQAIQIEGKVNLMHSRPESSTKTQNKNIGGPYCMVLCGVVWCCVVLRWISDGAAFQDVWVEGVLPLSSVVVVWNRLLGGGPP